MKQQLTGGINGSSRLSTITWGIDFSIRPPKDVDKKPAKFDWNAKYGLQCYQLLSKLYELPVTKRKDHLDNLIAEAGLLVEQIEDKMEG